MIGFAGLSHLGVVSSIAAATQGFQVVGCDRDEALCARLRKGELSIREPGLDDLLKQADGRIEFTADFAALARCEVIFVSLDVATDGDNQTELDELLQLLECVCGELAAGATLVILCQVPPGFTRRQLERGLDRTDIQVYYQVETLIFGRAVERATKPERIIVGCGDPAAPLPDLYGRFLDAFGCPVLKMRYESAELTKISINMCLIASISIANTMAELCEATGADWHEVVPALNLDRRIGPFAYLKPGLGIGGGNLERDLATVQRLAGEHGTDSRVIRAFHENSRHCRDWVLRAIRNRFPNDRGARIAVWGLSYKADTHSVKNSPSLALIDHLDSEDVPAYDPQADLGSTQVRNLNRTESPLEACANADALAVMTPWAEFATIEVEDVGAAMAGKTVIDPYRALDGDAYRAAGFDYLTIGR